jgi:hypothetical protein
MASYSNNYIAAPSKSSYELEHNRRIKSIHINQHMMLIAQCWFYFAHEFKGKLAN